ncbi:PREDICTED: protein hairless isoform X2 [Nicrophorus vespilloides]|uniref:Protein hairless isoform X2 n=1 Tax=Nicrophorus vespilloides TaxID=110193 RepID=A0ABM1MNZ2_NICVS|nr:PREDICTED: protein hairless isoform X2 [Nicrophorus vespilloides]
MGSSPNAMILSDIHIKRTSCTKMIKEEKDVLNGNGECTTEDAPRTNNCNSHGGRLKFFKDGKFILELESAREGERVSWVSVPRKTFWPPQGTASSTPSYRQESSTSLSDDNSSIQSSPWQRDHSWKQSNPRKNLSKELMFLYYRPAGLRFTKTGAKRRRRSHDSPKESSPQNNSLMCNNKRQPLLAVIQTLLEKLSSGSPRSETAVVSPRKRILRELETDCRLLKNVDSGQKRSRGKPTTVPSSIVKMTSPVRMNGTNAEPPGQVTAATPTRPARNNTSYSITSILSEDRKPKASPTHSPSHFSPGPASSVGVHQHQYSAGAATPTPEERWFTESVDKLRSIELSHSEAKRIFVPYTACSYMVPPYSYNFPMAPQYYHSPYPRSYPMPLYPLQMPVRPDAPSCSWAAEPARTDTEHRDENITDMPLNLSKHGA